MSPNLSRRTAASSWPRIWAEVLGCESAARGPHTKLGRCLMGDKSPKSKERDKKQHQAEKNQKQAAAFTKAHPVAELPKKKGK